MWPNVHGENKAKSDVDNEKKGSQFFGIEDEPQVAKINAKEKAETCNYGVIFLLRSGFSLDVHMWSLRVHLTGHQ